MATTLITVNCKLFQMMPNIIILKVRKSHQPTANRFSTTRKKPVGGHNPSLNRVKDVSLIFNKERNATKFERDTEEFYNPKITKVEDTVEGSSNELYAQNMEYRHRYDEIMKHFGEGRLKDAGAIQKGVHCMTCNVHLQCATSSYKYALWLDFRAIDDNKLHGSGRQLENTLQITKKLDQKVSCLAISIYSRMLKLLASPYHLIA